MISLSVKLNACTGFNISNVTKSEDSKISIDSKEIINFYIQASSYDENKESAERNLEVFLHHALKYNNEGLFNSLILYYLYENSIIDYYDIRFRDLFNLVPIYRYWFSANHITFIVREYTDDILKFIEYLKLYCSDEVYVYNKEEDGDVYEFASKIKPYDFGVLSFSFIKSPTSPFKLKRQIGGFVLDINGDEEDDGIFFKTNGTDKDLKLKAHALVKVLRNFRYPLPRNETFTNDVYADDFLKRID